MAGMMGRSRLGQSRALFEADYDVVTARVPQNDRPRFSHITDCWPTIPTRGLAIHPQSTLKRNRLHPGLIPQEPIQKPTEITT